MRFQSEKFRFSPCSTADHVKTVFNHFLLDGNLLFPVIFAIWAWTLHAKNPLILFGVCQPDDGCT